VIGARYTINLIVEAVHDGGPEPRDWDAAAEAVRGAIKGQTVRIGNGAILDLRAVVIDTALEDDQ
jgi:hypothetical protein